MLFRSVALGCEGIRILFAQIAILVEDSALIVNSKLTYPHMLIIGIGITVFC